MSDLADFLLARIADDEAAARALSDDWRGGEWRVADGLGVVNIYDEVILYREEDAVPAHVARWSPSRVLAECEAKRRLVERFADSIEVFTMSSAEKEFVPGAEDTDSLRLLALPYADHPNYDEEWRL